MCTVTLIPRQRGYLLGMNRDEQLARAPALPPQVRLLAGRRVAFPSEPGGGTWIALNDAGVTLALINWYAVTARIGRHPVSRGLVVASSAAAGTPEETAQALARLPLFRINPFRLIGVFPKTREIVEWRWDLLQLRNRRRPWRAQQFISSGFDEPQAQQVRGRVFEAARQQKTAGSAAWLQRLHRSHGPRRGAFSTCMHRPGAATVSFTQVVVGPVRGSLCYWAGPPCGHGQGLGVA